MTAAQQAHLATVREKMATYLKWQDVVLHSDNYYDAVVDAILALTGADGKRLLAVLDKYQTIPPELFQDVFNPEAVLEDWRRVLPEKGGEHD